MGRREPTGFGFHITLLIAGALAACTSATGSDVPAELPPTGPTVSASAPPSSSPAEPSDEEAVAAVWESLHSLRIEQTYSQGDVDGDAFAGLATKELGSTLVALMEARRGDIPMVSTAAEFWPEVAVAANGSQATISDCILVATRPADEPDAEPTVRSTVWSGSATQTSDSWVFDDVTLGQDNCVPAELNRELLDAYEAYHHIRNAAWDPADPEHPELPVVTTGQRLANLRQLLGEHREEGIAVRDPHDARANAVVFDLGIGTATVSDCHPAHPGYGAYDQGTNDRLDDVIAPVESGQVNLVSVDLVRMEDGTWKVEESGGLDKANCTPRGTDYVVAP